MGRISESLLSDILAKTNFISLYQEKLRLTRKGGKWWGLCPFHAEKTPSFSVDDQRGLFYCFGCQKGGSIIDFLMETDKLSFFEAVEELAERVDIKIPARDGAWTERDDKEEKERSSLLALNEKLAATFHWLLMNHESGKEAKSILLRRGIPEKTIEAFSLGYAPADLTWLFRFLSGKGYSAEFLSRSGLFASRNPRFPLFADRIIFPIVDQRGRYIAFGGRLIHGDGPKYINSPDTLVFRKQENLFALDKAAQAMKTEGKALVCEGYMDAISFHAAGVEYAVAPLGTAFTSRQAQAIARRAERLLLCFDSDQAGKKAAERACAISEAAGLSAAVVLVSEGKDASEILEKSGVDALKKIPDYSISSGEFLIRRAEELFDMTTVEGKSRASSFLYPYLDALGTEVKKNGFLEIVGRRLGINPTALLADYVKATAPDQRHPPRQAEGIGPAQKAGIARTADYFFMTAVLLKPELFPSVQEAINPDDFDDPRARDIFSALLEASQNGIWETASILPSLGDASVRRFVVSVAASGELDLDIDRVVKDGISRFKIRRLEKERLRLTMEIAKASAKREGDLPSGGDLKEEGLELLELMKRKMTLDKEISRLKGEVDE